MVNPILEERLGESQTDIATTLKVYTCGLVMDCIHDPFVPQYMCPMCNASPYAGGIPPSLQPMDPSPPIPQPRMGMLTGFDLCRESQIQQEETPEISVEPYQRGMPLEGGLNLYGNRSTAILHDPDTLLDIHHHNDGGGTVNFGSERIIELIVQKMMKG